jgi:hypothetical protein
MVYDLTGWTQAEFEAFVLLIAANADLRTDKQELRIIRGKAGEGLDKIQDLFDELNDIQRLDLVLANKNTFLPTDSDVERLKQEVHAVMTANGSESPIEREIEHLLNRLF